MEKQELPEPHQDTIEQPHRSLPDQLLDEALIQCIACIASRGIGIIGATDLAECRGSNRVQVGYSLQRLASGEFGEPLVEQRPDRKYRMTDACLIIEAEELAYCEGITAQTTAGKTAKKAASPPDEIQEIKKIATAPSWALDRIKEQPFLSGRQITSVAATLQACLRRNILRVDSLDSQKSLSGFATAAKQNQTFDIASGEFIAPGSLLASEGEVSRRAILHAWRLDWLIYGQVLDATPLKHALNMRPNDSLAAYAQAYLARININD